MKRERVIERRLKQRCEALGATVLKFTPAGSNGWPDRIIFLAGGIALFAETKAPDKDLEPLQKIRRRDLQKLGFWCERVRDEQELKNLENEIRRNG